ncbi:amino acid ABC transporter permease [Pseudalkalibacillus hwajinpoensis]|uniref:Amino acid ABC transporter permease n=2 Tax=Guptibacillus hwajinpoensis TaxID=208199 RepID=A0A4U1MF24_9BACL|nr:amino acid ABC transporter permease [Pseudalkalibacillus hwajinpoensis]
MDVLINSLPFLLEGAKNTLLLSFFSIFGALIVGLVIALLRLSKNKVAIGVAKLYVSFFRGTPLLIQLFILYYGLVSVNIELTAWQAAYTGLILHFGAYISESFRAAILSLSKGQWEAAMSLGMKKSLIYKEVILPQAWRRAIPPVWNSLIDIVKASSLASVLTISELTYNADQLAASTYKVLPILLTAALIYWFFTTILNIIQSILEKRLYIPSS